MNAWDEARKRIMLGAVEQTIAVNAAERAAGETEACERYRRALEDIVAFGPDDEPRSRHVARAALALTSRADRES